MIQSTNVHGINSVLNVTNIGLREDNVDEIVKIDQSGHQTKDVSYLELLSLLIQCEGMKVFTR